MSQFIIEQKGRIHDGMWMAGMFVPDWRVGAAVGTNEDIGSVNWETMAKDIRVSDSLYPWRTTGAQLFGVSTNANDVGIDYVNYGIRPFSHSVPFESFIKSFSLNGQSPVLLDADDIQDIHFTRLGDGQVAAEGIVRIFAGTAIAGVPQDLDLVLSTVDNVHNISQNCVVSCPAGISLGLRGFGCSVDNKEITFRPAWRSPDENGVYGDFLQQGEGRMSGGFVSVKLTDPFPIGGAGTQVELRILAASGGGSASASGIVEYRLLDRARGWPDPDKGQKLTSGVMQV